MGEWIVMDTIKIGSATLPYLQRRKVDGGWLYRTVEYQRRDISDMSSPSCWVGVPVSVALVFVPEAPHA